MFKKLKNDYIEIIKKHPVSVISVLVSMILCGLSFESLGLEASVIKSLKNARDFGACFLLVFAVGVLALEAYRVYKLSIGEEYSFKQKKYLIPNVVVTIFGIAAALFTSLVVVYDEEIKEMWFQGDTVSFNGFSEYVSKITLLYAVCAICATLYFFLKKSKSSFETYTTKAFCGLMKAELVFFVIFIGITLIIMAFNALIFDTGEDTMYRVWFILVGLVQYPCLLIGLSKTDDDMSKFGKVMLSYVLPGLLAIAFVIIYVYIIKILVTWTFPQNQLFAILTALFCFGVFIWTMAFGICDDNMKKVFIIMPLLFIPFIILQIMCLYMRIAPYGLTLSRYAGIAFVLFEVVYFGLYIFNIVKKKDAMQIVLAVIAAMFFLTLLAPWVNATSAVFASQKGKVEKYFANEESSKSAKLEAYEAYRVLNRGCGYKGQKYVEDNISDSQVDELKEAYIVDGPSDNPFDYVFAVRDVDYLDISGDYSKMYVVELWLRENETEDEDIDTKNIEVVSTEEFTGTVDLEELINKLTKMEKSNTYSNSDIKLEGELAEPIELKEGGKLYITRISITLRDDVVEDLQIDGYVFK